MYLKRLISTTNNILGFFLNREHTILIIKKEYTPTVIINFGCSFLIIRYILKIFLINNINL